MLVQFAISEIFYRSMPLNAADVREMITQGKFAWGQFALFSLMSAFLWLWIVVGWHRYILLNERPRLVPAFRFGRMLGYFGKSLLIALILAPLGLILGFIAGGIVSATALGSSNLIVILIVMGLVVYLPVSTVGMRLVSMLPGAALQSDVPVFSGWEATRGATTTILGVVILSGSLLLRWISLAPGSSRVRRRSPPRSSNWLSNGSSL